MTPPQPRKVDEQTEQSCGNCKFLHQGSNRCRRFPPQAVEIGVFNSPEMYRDWWCGEWQALPPPKLVQLKPGDRVRRLVAYQTRDGELPVGAIGTVVTAKYHEDGTEGWVVAHYHCSLDSGDRFASGGYGCDATQVERVP